jgi:hypothetical protein
MKIEDEEEEVEAYLEVVEVEEGEDNPSTKLSLSVSNVTS